KRNEIEIYISIMEIFELRYFLAVAEVENVNNASKTINVSPGSLSKAIGRLEDELQTLLFFRVGRGIRLTPEGKLLKLKAAQIVGLEEDVRFELKGKDSGSLNIYISSEEVLQTAFGLKLVSQINELFPLAKSQFLIREESKAIEQVREGESHLAFITGEPPKDLKSKTIARVNFQTCASRMHPLIKKYGHKKSIPIEKVLKHPFVSPDTAILGRISNSSSNDGWRDDKFPRKIQYKVCGLKLMENLIQNGSALGYLPDYFIKDCNLIPLKVTGCPYSCKQTVQILAKDPSQLSWLNRLWNSFN
ncbi:MAG: LysR family transcriptional regulator, partial [Bdellovibrionales bacterium]|nr:LysR family transcriptional regulator [Bdellovibrionales bacterium]